VNVVAAPAFRPVTAMTAEPEQATYQFATVWDVQNSPSGEFQTLFLRGLTHKLNNLLAVFSGFTSLLMMSDSLDESAQEGLGHMKAAAQNAHGLSEKILAAGGCVRVTTQRLALSDYLPMADRSLREPCQKLGVPFELRADPALPAVEIDPTRFKEILIELLKNAAEAAKEVGGTASLEIYGPGRSPEGTFDRVDIFVHNDGAIRPDKQAEMFDPFVSSKDGSHYGIGLTVAAMLAGQMKCTLAARTDGQRTTFWLSVPVAG
jgi:signal transduction histidine kinase